MGCNGICIRFLAQLRRVHNGRPITEGRGGSNYRYHKPHNDFVRGSHGHYDSRTYDYRVVKGHAGIASSPFEGYRRCAKCQIYIAVGFYDNVCPCCGNSHLSTRLNSRETNSYGKSRY